MAFFYGVGTHTDTAHKGTAKRDTALGVCGLDANKVPLIYTNNHSSQVRAVDADPATKGASITSFEDPAYTGTDYMSNGYFDGTNWLRYDISEPCHSLFHDAANDEVSLWRSEPAANPITNWVKLAVFSTDGSDNFALSLLGNGVYASVPVIDATTYVGNATANRAVAHGLGRVPKAVFILPDNAALFIRLIESGQIHGFDSTTGGRYAVTAMDATNFYVGNVGNYGYSGNSNAVNYFYMVIA